MDITPHASVESFFREVVGEGMRRAGVAPAEPTECYLVALLGEFTTASITSEPLSLKLANAPSDLGARVATLKQVGDTSLYVTGFFAASLERQLVDAEYYIGLGETAYRELARRLATSSIRDVYQELAAKFPRFVDVLTAVREQVDFASTDVVRLYQQWLSSRSDWIERRLQSLGVLVGGTHRGALH
jgi:hypothetical protein